MKNLILLITFLTIVFLLAFSGCHKESNQLPPFRAQKNFSIPLTYNGNLVFTAIFTSTFKDGADVYEVRFYNHLSMKVDSSTVLMEYCKGNPSYSTCHTLPKFVLTTIGANDTSEPYALPLDDTYTFDEKNFSAAFLKISGFTNSHSAVSGNFIFSLDHHFKGAADAYELLYLSTPRAYVFADGKMLARFQNPINNEESNLEGRFINNATFYGQIRSTDNGLKYETTLDTIHLGTQAVPYSISGGNFLFRLKLSPLNENMEETSIKFTLIP